MAVGVGVGTRRGQGHCVGVDEAIVVGRGRGGERGRGHGVDCGPSTKSKTAAFDDGHRLHLQIVEWSKRDIAVM